MAFIDLTLDDERLVSAPAAGLLRAFGVENIFAADHDFGELTVSGCPGGDDLRRGGVTENDADRAEEMLADDGVVFGTHFKARMFVRDAFDHAAEPIEVIDVRSISEDGSRQAARLTAVALIGGIEYIPQFRVGVEQFAIKGLRDGFAMLLQDGDSGSDDLSMLR